jgi:hypothetical protein
LLAESQRGMTPESRLVILTNGTYVTILASCFDTRRDMGWKINKRSGRGEPRLSAGRPAVFQEPPSGPIPQPHPSASAVLRNELDAGCLKSALDNIKRRIARR